MEFPDLGAHCHEKTCHRLDFLPMKCDECSFIFCKDHVGYSSHSCENAYQKNVQVPVCPLCNRPVPSKRGETPDIAVGEHIDRDCMSDPAVNKRQIYTNMCSLKSCRNKELMPVTCSSCRRNYCLKHRHPIDHKCETVNSSGKGLSPAGAAAVARSQNSKHGNSTATRISNFMDIRNHFAPKPRQVPVPSAAALQAGLSEDKALAIALQQSMIENHADCHVPSLQDQEDQLLAQALAASERDQGSRSRGTQGKEKCTIS